MSYEFKYTAPPTVSAFMRSTAFLRLIKGPFGCLSADTEFLTPTGWRRIDEYRAGDAVAQWHENGALQFVEPSNYIVQPCRELIWFRNKSLSMQLSDEHRVPVYDWAGNFRVKTAARLAKKPSSHILPTTFVPQYEDAPVSDAELRLAVAINADAHHVKRGFQTIICVRKERKKERIRKLLADAGVSFIERSYPYRPTEVSFAFIHDYKGKTYTGWYWWALSQRQLRIVIEEMSHWDGLFEGPDTRFHSNVREDADFIQYATHAIGGKATIRVQTSYPKNKNWNPTYIVHIAMPGSVKTVATLRKDAVVIDRVPTADGKKYCFTVPTGFFLVRHNGCIFVTGNSGKSAGCVTEVFRQAIQMPAGPDGIRRSRYGVIRNTRQQLKDTTLKTWFDWVKPGIFGHWRESDMTFVMQFKDVYSEIQFRPLDTPEDIQRVLSMEWSGAWGNEIRELPVELLLAIIGRVGRYPRRADVPEYRDFVIGDTNPPEIDSEWHRVFEHLPLEEGNPDSVIECDVFHQPSGLSPEAENIQNLKAGYYENLAKGKAKAWVDTYVHGLYSPSQSGKAVYNDTFRPARHISPKRLKPDPYLPVVISFDCGLTPAATFKQMGLDGRVRTLMEAVAFDMGMKRFSKTMLRPIIKNFFPGNALIFIGDPAGKRRADSDESSAFKVLQEDYEAEDAIVKAAATNDPKVRIQATEQMLSQYPDGEPLMVIDPSCKWYIEALRSKYRYPKIKSTGSFSENPEKNNWSHVAEAGQYGDLYLLSGKYDPADHVRHTDNSFNPHQPYRPAQKEGY